MLFSKEDTRRPSAPTSAHLPVRARDGREQTTRSYGAPAGLAAGGKGEPPKGGQNWLNRYATTGGTLHKNGGAPTHRMEVPQLTTHQEGLRHERNNTASTAGPSRCAIASNHWSTPVFRSAAISEGCFGDFDSSGGREADGPRERNAGNSPSCSQQHCNGLFGSVERTVALNAIRAAARTIEPTRAWCALFGISGPFCYGFVSSPRTVCGGERTFLHSFLDLGFSSKDLARSTCYSCGVVFGLLGREPLRAQHVQLPDALFWQFITPMRDRAR